MWVVMTSQTRRKFIKGAAGAGTVGLAGCTGGDNGDSGGDFGRTSTTVGSPRTGELDEVNAVFASSLQPGTYENQAIALFKEKMAEDTDGNFVVEHVPGGSYGGEVEQTQTLKAGGITGMGAGPLPLFLWANEYWFAITQWVIETYEDLLKVMYSDEFNSVYKDTIRDQNNVRRIGRHIYMGMRSHTANKAVRTPDDVKGLKLRVPGLDSWVAMWSAVGANPTSIPADEIYSALQTGTADGATADANQALSTNLYEVQSHYNVTRQLVGNRNLYINEDFFQDLDETYQDLVIQNGWEASVEIAEKSLNEEENNLQELEDEGMTVVRDVDYDAFKELATPAIRDVFESDWALSLDWVNETIEQGSIPESPPSA
jgi:TRAP-type C4-dicarboxylate transport system substrate-binding protein